MSSTLEAYVFMGKKADTQSIVPRNAQKQRTGENYQYTSVPMEIRLKLFFAQLILSISPVSTEQSQICAKNTNPAMFEQGDLFWQDNLTHCLCRQVR